MKTKAVIEKGFKETEIGLIPEDWKIVKLGDVAEISSGGSAPQGDNYFNGKNPFIRVQHIDREGDRVIKWDLITDDAVKKYKLKIYPKGAIVFPKSGASIYLEKRATLPIDAYIVSHLCAVISNDKNVNQKFLFYELRNIELSKDKADGYPTLNLSEVKNVKVIIPSLLEQQKISFVLSKIQQAIEQQHKIIETARELKKSIMNKLFTEGLHGEEQKETEIGLMPKSWRIETVINIVEKTKQKNPSQTPELTFKYIDVSGISNEFYKIIEYRTYNGSKAPSRARKLVQTDDVLFATVRPTLRRMAYIDEKYNGEICSTAFCVLRSKKSILSSLYLYYCVQRDEFIEELAKLQRGASYPAITDNDVKRQQIPLSSFREQNEITDILSSIDKKIFQAESKKQTLQALFKTMLNQLMTGKVRVKDFDFEVKENV
jgi:type I restriction enzyme S subunit